VIGVQEYVSIGVESGCDALMIRNRAALFSIHGCAERPVT
jgi:hypothetical protein